MENKQKVINIYGGPFSGKSTIAAGAFSLLKMHGVDIELVTEFPKDLSWENRDIALKNQVYVLSEQYHKMFRLIGNVDYIITDSPLLLSEIYSKCEHDSFYSLIDCLYWEFNNINFFIDRIYYSYASNGRVHTEEEAIEKDKWILQLLLDTNDDVVRINGDYTGINKVVERVLGKDNVELRMSGQ